MEKQLKTLIYLLHKSIDPLTDSELAQLLGVSKRTVQNYIHEVNKNKLVIKKKTSGYILLDDSLAYNLSYKLKDTPQARRKIILKNLLQDKNDIEKEYLETLYIGISTFNTDIAYLKTKVECYDVQIITRQNKIYLQGSEYEKRKILNLMALWEDYDLYTDDRYKENNQIIQKILKKHKFKTNNFTLKYLCNHINIMLDRIMAHCLLQHYEYDNKYIQIYEIAHDIMHALHIDLPEKELVYVQELLSSIQLNTFNSNNSDAFFIELIQSIVTQVNFKYDINIHLDQFKNHFLQHLKNLYYRYINHIKLDNPLSVISKNEYPLIHDIAVYVSSIIENYLNIILDENEISFISFHLGAYLTTQNNNKLNFAFIYQNNSSLDEHELQEILKYFDNELNLAYTSLYNDNLESILKINYIDFIITTDMSFDIEGYKIIRLSPNFDIYTKNIISQTIVEILKVKENKRIQQWLLDYLKNDLFLFNDAIKTQSQYFEYICNILMSKGYIDENFKKNLYCREQKSSTAFIDGFAMPHTLSVNAKKTFISFFISKTDIYWDKNSNVRLIVMIGIDEKDKKKFRLSLELLTKLLLNIKLFSKILQIESYEEFIDMIEHNLLS